MSAAFPSRSSPGVPVRELKSGSIINDLSPLQAFTQFFFSNQIRFQSRRPTPNTRLPSRRAKAHQPPRKTRRAFSSRSSTRGDTERYTTEAYPEEPGDNSEQVGISQTLSARMQADNTGRVEHQLRHTPAVDDFRSRRLKRGDSERMAQYVYQERNYENASTDGGRLEGQGFSMREETPSRMSPLSEMTSATSQASTVGIATVVSGITAEGEAMRHGEGGFGTQSSYVPPPLQMQQPPPQQYALPQRTQQPLQHEAPLTSRHHEPHSNTHSSKVGEPVSPKATGYQQPFFSRPIKGVDTR